MYLNNRLLILSCFIILFLLSCSNSQITSNNTKTENLKQNNNSLDRAPIKQEGFRFHYIFEQKNKKSLIHKVKEGEKYKAGVNIINYSSFENSFRLYIFVDNKLVKILNNNKSVKYLDFPSLPPNEGKTEYFVLDNLSKGKHELVAVLVRNPEQNLSKKEYVAFVNFTKEFTIIIGDESKKHLTKKDKIVNIENSNILGTKLTYLTKQGVATNPENSITLMDLNKRVLKSTLNFWNSQPNTIYSIIAMDNNEQIDLNDIKYNVKNVGSISLNLNLTLNNNKKHNIILLLKKQNNRKDDEDLMTTNKITIYSDIKTEFD